MDETMSGCAVRLFDYHVHTSLCRHAEGTVNDYLEQAVKNGIRAICFTDHMPLPGALDHEYRMSMKEVDRYFETVAKARRQYPELEVGIGIEAEYIAGLERYIEDFLCRYPFDLTLMSVHLFKLNKNSDYIRVFDYVKGQINTEDDEVIKRAYYGAILEGVKTGLYDVVSHLDLIEFPRGAAGKYLCREAREKATSVRPDAKPQTASVSVDTSRVSGERMPCGRGFVEGRSRSGPCGSASSEKTSSEQCLSEPGRDHTLPLNPTLETVIEVIAGSRMSVEINTSGWRKRRNECYPSPALVQQLVRAGVPFTLGSDAHSPAHVGFAIQRALLMLSELPGAMLARYRQRTRCIQPLVPASPIRVDAAP